MKWLKRMENIFSAVAFAEAGEFETAIQMAKEDDDTIGKETVGKKEHARSEEKQDTTHYPSRA